MKKLVLLVTLGIMTLALVGGVLWVSAKGLDPVKFVRDALTGYQSGHARHQFSPSLAVRWDPIGDHNAAVDAVPVDQRAYPVLAEFAARAEVMGAGAWRGPSGLAPSFVGAEPGDEEWDTLAAWIEGEEGRELLRLITETASRPKFGQSLSDRGVPIWDDILRRHGAWVMDDPSPPAAYPLAINMVLPAMKPATAGVSILDARARLAAERGDRAGLVAAVGPMVRLAGMVDDPPFLISQIIALRFASTARARMAAVLSEHPDLIDEPMAALFESWLAEPFNDGSIRPDARWELTAFEDVIRRVVDDRGVYVRAHARIMAGVDDFLWVDDPPPPSTAPLASFNADLLASHAWLERYIASGLAGLEIPWTPITMTKADAQAWVKQRDSAPGSTGHRLVGAMVLDWQVPAQTFRTARQDAVGLRVALAAHRHQLRHAQPPASLDAIDADLLAFDPVDGFTGGRLVYRWRADAHLVYALGADGDDDAGRHATDPDDKPVPTISDDYLRGKWDGDWLVFPPRE